MPRNATTRLARSTSPHTQPARHPLARKILPLLTLGALFLAPEAQPQEKGRGWCGNGPLTPDLQVVDPDGKPMGRFPLEHTEVRAQVAGQTAQQAEERKCAPDGPRKDGPADPIHAARGTSLVVGPAVANPGT